MNTISLQNFAQGVSYGIFYLKGHLLNAYVLVPVGIILELMVLYGLNQFIIQILKIKFPASVLGMLINLGLLVVLDSLSKIVPQAGVVLHYYLKITNPSMNFSLKWINIFFVPSFVILPLSKPITIIEVLKIAAVFVIGWWVLMLINVYSIHLIKILFLLHKKPEDHHTVNTDEKPFTSTRDITTIDLRTVNTEPSTRPNLHDIDQQSLEQNEIMELQDIDPVVRPLPSYQSSPANFMSAITTNTSSTSEMTESPPPQQPSKYPHLSSEAQDIVLFITKYIDWIIYGLLFIASLPLYYISSYHLLLPFHLSVTMLCYYTALLIPLKYPVTKKFAHPILIATFLILFICFISSLIYYHKPVGFLWDLKYYKTGKNYLNLFSDAYLFNNGENNNQPDLTKYPIWPGCGDFLSSLMDISIVSLSLPVFTHRRDFVQNFWIMVPILMSIALTFFLYPLICYNIGIDSKRSIGFIGRSVTLALGTPLIDSLDGLISLMAVCTILSGICGVLIGDLTFKLLRVKNNDYVTRGVSLGINCGAIATAHLLNTDPRAASMSSLSFTIFGTMMVIFASIGEIRNVIHAIVGM